MGTEKETTKKEGKEAYYPSYLQLERILSSQRPLSREANNEAHDETLFIIVHQVFELWFKQIHHELDSIIQKFDSHFVQEQELGQVVSRLDRIIKIQELFEKQLDVMETMTPMDFLEFRNYIVPASGFQSFQYRCLEISLGLKELPLYQKERGSFLSRLKGEAQEKILAVESRPSLLRLVAQWLQRLPFIKDPDFDFWQSYQDAVAKMFDEDQKLIQGNTTLTEKSIQMQLEMLKSTREHFSSLFSEDKHKKFREEGHRILELPELQGALFIFLYRDEPILQLPYRLLNNLMTIDTHLARWRQRHALMAQRMLGSKIGSGGSSGHKYLSQTVESRRIFADFFNLSSFLLPRSKLPKVPENIRQKMSFYSSINT